MPGHFAKPIAIAVFLLLIILSRSAFAQNSAAKLLPVGRSFTPCTEVAGKGQSYYLSLRRQLIDAGNDVLNQSQVRGKATFDSIGSSNNVMIMMYSPADGDIAERFLDTLAEKRTVSESMCEAAFRLLLGIEAQGRKQMYIKSAFFVTREGLQRTTSRERDRIQQMIDASR